MTTLLPARRKHRSEGAPVQPGVGPTYLLTPKDPKPRRGLSWWLRRLVPLALLLTLLALAVWWAAGPPLTLDSAVLRGPREVQGPVCVETYVDWSSSMNKHQSQRQEALDALNRFATRELEPTDVYMEVAFATTSAVTVPPTPFRDLGPARLNDGGIDTSGTALLPAIVVAQRGRSRVGADCAARATVLVSDGEVHDELAALAPALRSGRFTRVFLVTPGYWGRPGPFSRSDLAGVEVKHFWSSKRLGVVYADVVAEMTGQQVGHRR